MPINDFKAFAISENANVLKQSEYESLPAVGEGFQSGIARSEELNKVWRQASTIASVIASFMANNSGQDVLDNGDLNTLQETLLKALLNNSTSQLDDRYLNAELNLSDINDAKVACDNLGLTKTVELADGALQKDKNLSDVPDKPKARKNLELGAVAIKDAVTSMTDVTEGRVPVVGWMGLGGSARASAAGDVHVGRMFYEPFQSGTLYPVSVAVMQSAGPTPTEWGQMAISYGEDFRIFAGHGVYNKTPEITEFYHDKRKPTAIDTGAYPITGGELKGSLKAEGFVQSGEGFDVVSMRDIWAKGVVYQNNMPVSTQDYAQGRANDAYDRAVIWAYQNLVADVRLSGIQEYIDIPYPGQVYPPAGSCITAIDGTTKSTGSGVSFHVSRLYLQRIQKVINGIPYNIA